MTQVSGFVDLRNLNHNKDARSVIIVLTVFMFFDFVFIGIRLYARRIMKKHLEVNDYAILVGIVNTCSL